MVRLLLCVLILGAVSCRTAAPPPLGDEEDCEWVPPDGEPSLFTLAGQTLGAVSVAEPLECKWGARYIELRGTGARTLVLAQELPKGAQRCTQAPRGEECPQIQVDFFVAAAWNRLSDAGIYTVGAGRGPCGDAEGAYDAWNFSIGISDWTRADEAVRIVAEEMEKWGIGNQIGVAVRNAYCGKPAAS